MGLARLLTCMLAVGSLVLAVGCMLGVARSADRWPVYAVATVQAGLAHRPSAWVGRTVWVRGVAVIYSAHAGYYMPRGMCLYRVTFGFHRERFLW
jgi:hypothetical protein